MRTSAFQHPASVRLSAQGRVQSVELLRIMAAFGIVVFHAGSPAREFGYAGLVVFLVLAPAIELGVNHGRRRSAWALFLNLLVPWALWSVLYGAVHLGTGKPVMETGSAPLSLVVGTAIHLWFLPFLFAALLVLGSVKQRLPAELLFWPATLGTSAMLVTASLWYPAAQGWDAPLVQWLHAAPALLCGGAPRVARGAAASGLAVVAAALTWLCLSPVADVTIPYVVGTLAIALALALAPAADRLRLNVQSAASCMMGVYLVHVLALGAARRILGDSGLVLPLSAFILSLGAVWALQRFVPRARVLFGAWPQKAPVIGDKPGLA